MIRRFLLGFAAIGSLAAQTLTFAPVSLSAGSSPKSIVLADFNRDGNLDLAVVNAGGINQNNVTLLMGESGVTFSNPLISATGGLGSIAMTSGDFNHDGKRDLAVANNISNDVSILLGNGDGTFQKAVSYGAHSGPVAIAAGDFNGEGDITILLGKGDGSFGMQKNISVGSSPTSVKVADLNGDGILDLAITNGTQGEHVVMIFLGNGDGTFLKAGTATVGNEPYALAVGNFNLDGKPDLAAANLAGNNMSVLLGNGDGTFQPAANYAAGIGTLAIRVGDFNVDHKADLAVCADLSAAIMVFLGNGDGTFQKPQPVPLSSSCNSLAVGDINLDGKPDMAVATTSGITLLINTSP
jgi:hypothetical protein